MNLTLRDLVADALATLKSPRDGARKIMGLDLPRVACWQALLAVTIVSVLLAEVSLWLMPRPEDLIFGPLLANPLMAVVVQSSLLVIMVFAIFWIGRAMGGDGGFGDTILIVAWMQFIMALLQIVQTAAMVLVPPLGALIGLAGFVIFFWLLTNFVAELHGFQSLGQVLVMIIVAGLGIGFGLSILLTLVGFSLPGA